MRQYTPPIGLLSEQHFYSKVLQLVYLADFWKIEINYLEFSDQSIFELRSTLKELVLDFYEQKLIARKQDEAAARRNEYAALGIRLLYEVKAYSNHELRPDAENEMNFHLTFMPKDVSRKPFEKLEEVLQHVATTSPQVHEPLHMWLEK